MRTVKTLKPVQTGTDIATTNTVAGTLKAVELVVQRRSLEREAECLGSRTPGGQSQGIATRRVKLGIGRRERDVQRRVKSAGGWWNLARRFGYCGATDVVKRFAEPASATDALRTP